MNKSKVSIGLSNPKSPENVDSVMRAAGNYRVDSVFYTGERYPRAAKYRVQTADLARKVSKGIPLSAVTSLIDGVAEDSKIICIEIAENAIALPDFVHPQHALYIFGPEDGSLSQQIIDSADAVVYIPTRGCMNLAATVNVVLYDRLAKSTQSYSGNELIRQNRDINNSLQVKNK